MSRTIQLHPASIRRELSDVADESLWSRVEEILERRLASDGNGGAPVTELMTGSGRFQASLHELAAHHEGPVLVVIAVEQEASALPSLDELQAFFGFTEREGEVALLLAERMTNREIAETLDVTAHTARRHTEKVLLKLGLNSRFDVHEALLTDRRRRPVSPRRRVRHATGSVAAEVYSITPDTSRNVA